MDGNKIGFGHIAGDMRLYETFLEKFHRRVKEFGEERMNKEKLSLQRVGDPGCLCITCTKSFAILIKAG